MGAEVWKDIPGYEGQYQVSDMGRVKSLPRRVRCGAHGRGWRTVPEKILRPGRSTSGHLTVTLGKRGGSRNVHALVLQAFLGPAPYGTEVCHNNGNPEDNRLRNLRYDTRSENIKDVLRQGGSWHGSLMLTQIQDIRQQLTEGKTETAIAKLYGVQIDVISRIKRGATFAWA
jgi:hypothetical protein